MAKGNVLLFVWIASLCVTIGAHKDPPWKPGMERFFKALTREVDSHLKNVFSGQMSAEATSTPPHAEFGYSKAIQVDIQHFFDTLKKAVDSHVDKKGSGNLPSKKGYKTSPVAQTTEAYKTSQSTTEKYTTPRPPSTTKKYTTPRPPSTTKKYATPRPKSTTEKHTTPQLQSTTEVYTKTHQATAEGYGKEHQATAEGYGKEHQATAEGYGKEHHSRTDCLYSSEAPVSHGPILVGSIKGVPGVHFPNYTEIPLTSFTCYDKEFLPGFYADLETGCQVFHVCWSNRRESFLCPLGTIFNQALLACDYWYSANCSLAPHYYKVNAETSHSDGSDLKSETLSSMISSLLQQGPSSTEGPLRVTSIPQPDTVLSFISQFLPVKAKITVYPETEEKRAKVVASTSIGAGKVQEFRKSTASRVQEPAPLHVKIPLDSTSKPKLSKEESDAYQKAVKIFVDRLSVAIKTVVHEIIDVSQKNGTVKTIPHVPGKQTPIKEKPGFAIEHDFGEYDAATKMLLDRITDGLMGWFRGGFKSVKKDAVHEIPEPVEKGPEQKVPEPVKKDPGHKIPEPVQEIPKPVKPLTQLNPRFIVKPAAIPKEVKTEESVHLKTKRIAVKHSIPKSGQDIALNSIMPLTKKKLISNYIRLLKIKRA